MKKNTINLNRSAIEAYLENKLEQKLLDIQESMENGTSPKKYLDGPDPDTVRDIWDELFKLTSTLALRSLRHEPISAYTGKTVKYLIRNGRGKIEGTKSFLYTDVRLTNSLYRIHKDSYELGDAAVQLREVVGLDNVETGLKEDELAEFLLAFDAMIPFIREKIDQWRRTVENAAQRALASNKADEVAEVTINGLLEKHVHPLGIDWTCSVSRGIAGIALYGPRNDDYFEISVEEFRAFIQDQKAFSSLLRRIGVQAA